MTARAAQRRRRVQAGFTVLELMVALMAGAIAVSTIYYISAASSKHFHEQQRVAQTQTALRMAMEQLRRDVGRAGYLGTPNAAREQRCPAVNLAAPVQAIEYLWNANTAALPNAAANNVRADRLRLTGNYATGDAYRIYGTSNGSVLRVATEWQSFRRTFGTWPPGVGTFDATAFAQVFAVGRILHITSTQRNHYFTRITGVNAAAAEITINPSFPIAACGDAALDNALIAPLSRIEWFVTSDPASVGAANLIGTGGNFRGQAPSLLVRREIAFGNIGAAAVPVAGSERIAMEFVAEVGFEFIWDQQLARGAAPLLQRPATPNLSTAIANANPHRARSVLISLSARTQDEDPTWAYFPRAAGAPLTRYRVTAGAVGSARVRTANAEVFLPNLAGRTDMRP